MRERIARMRARLFAVDDRTVFWERVLALRRVHRTHGHERRTRLYALAMREITATMSVVIGEDDLILGEPPEILLSPEEETLFAAYADRLLPAVMVRHARPLDPGLGCAPGARLARHQARSGGAPRGPHP